MKNAGSILITLLCVLCIFYLSFCCFVWYQKVLDSKDESWALFSGTGTLGDTLNPVVTVFMILLLLNQITLSKEHHNDQMKEIRKQHQDQLLQMDSQHKDQLREAEKRHQEQMEAERKRLREEFRQRDFENKKQHIISSLRQVMFIFAELKTNQQLVSLIQEDNRNIYDPTLNRGDILMEGFGIQKGNYLSTSAWEEYNRKEWYKTDEHFDDFLCRFYAQIKRINSIYENIKNSKTGPYGKLVDYMETLGDIDRSFSGVLNTTSSLILNLEKDLKEIEKKQSLDL